MTNPTMQNNPASDLIERARHMANTLYIWMQNGGLTKVQDGLPLGTSIPDALVSLADALAAKDAENAALKAKVARARSRLVQIVDPYKLQRHEWCDIIHTALKEIDE